MSCATFPDGTDFNFLKERRVTSKRNPHARGTATIRNPTRTIMLTSCFSLCVYFFSGLQYATNIFLDASHNTFAIPENRKELDTTEYHYITETQTNFVNEKTGERERTRTIQVPDVGSSSFSLMI